MIELVTKGYLNNTEITVVNEFQVDINGIVELEQALSGSLINILELEGVVACQ